MFLSKDRILEKPIPAHIAIILDGNGRWAKKRGLPRKAGHYNGAINLKNIALECNSLGVKCLTVYAFSTENWKRPEEEVNYLMTAPVEYYDKYRDKILSNNIRISFIGRRDRFPHEFLKRVLDVEELTKDKTGLHLVIAADYGSQYELTEATKKISQLVNRGALKVDEITPELIEGNLFTSNLPKLDLLIRTSGEIRISNFLLWQLSYSELYFTKVYWPAFNKKELYKAIYDYQHRNRRYGGLKEEKK